MLPGDAELFGFDDDHCTPTNVPTLEEKVDPRRNFGTLSVTVTSELYEHQMAGVQWLYERHCKGSGALLADEMGLGKTAQVSAFIGELLSKGRITTCVVVCPPTLVAVWLDAFRRWGSVPASRIREALGNKKQRDGVWTQLGHRTPLVVMTTYGMMKNDKELIGRHSVDYLVLDEAHAIRDPRTDVFEAAVFLQPKAMHRIAISGTPLMNNFEDLWALFAFVDPNCLGSSRKDFKATSTAISRGNEKDSLRAEKDMAAQRLAALREAVRPLTLRREKRDVGETMRISKLDLVVWCELSPVQEQQYCEFIRSDVVRLALREIRTRQPLVLLTALRMMCNHPWLNFNEENFSRAMITPNCSPSEFPDFGDIFGGVKVNVAVGLLRQFTSERLKTLVFSRSKRLLDIMASLLAARSLSFVRIDGDVAVDKRSKIVSTFNTNPNIPICLITAQVGGVGLTFQSASRVLLLDPSWNPAVDAQAVDRVHRIGQTRDVVICRLITCGTVDEMIYRNQVFKTMAAKQVAGDNSTPPELRRYFSHTELRAMFEVGNLRYSDTARQLNEFHPPAIEPEFLEALRAIGGITNVSDNSQLFSEDRVNESTSNPEGLGHRRLRQRKKTDKPMTQVLDDIEQAVLLDDDFIPFSLGLPATLNQPAIRRSGSLRSASPALSLGRYSGARCSIFEQGCSLAEIVKHEVYDTDVPHFLFRGVSMPVLQLPAHRMTVAWTPEDTEDDDNDVDISWEFLEQAERASRSERARRAATLLHEAAARLSTSGNFGRASANSGASLGHVDPSRPSLVLGRPSQ
jgi:superfamily II DNA or RNA helicase